MSQVFFSRLYIMDQVERALLNLLGVPLRNSGRQRIHWATEKPLFFTEPCIPQRLLPVILGHGNAGPRRVSELTEFVSRGLQDAHHGYCRERHGFIVSNLAVLGHRFVVMPD